jgi:hypothetical protein
VIARVEWHRSELIHRVGFIVTNLRWATNSVVHFYKLLGTAEQMLNEGKTVVFTKFKEKWDGNSRENH